MRALITGNMGYVGPRVVRHLRAIFPDAFLAGADNGWFAPLLTDAAVLPEAMLDVQYFCDVRSLPRHVLDSIDTVIHLAGVSNDPIGDRYATVTDEINRKGSVELASLAKAAGVRRFVFASSCSVYGLAEDAPRTERSAVNPLTAYAKSKIEAEIELEKLATDDFRVTSLRFATACGMSERLRLDLVLNDFVASAVAARRIHILSDGTPWRPLIDVDDMALAVEWAATRDGDPYIVANAGRNDANYSVRQLADAVAAAIPGTEVLVAADGQPDKRSYRVDFSLYEALAPRHQPRVTLRESIEHLRNGLLAMGYSTADVRQSPWIRLRTLAALQLQGLLGPDLHWAR